MKNEILTASGQISEYGFACGYVQTENIGTNLKELYKEHNTYHLKMFRNGERVIWLSYDNLKDARKDYRNTSLE